MQITPGRIYSTSYQGQNRRSSSVTARAVPSVAPGLAAEHLKKLECFCFTEQAFGPEESRELGVTFMLDPELPEHIDTVTLSYALFAVEK